MKGILRKVRNRLLMLLGGSALGAFLLIVVCGLPTETAKAHIYASLPSIENGFSGELLPGYPGTFLGNFTDCLMLENCVYRSQGHSLGEQALCMYRGESGTGAGWATGYSLIDYLEGVPQGREVEYARYWHGYLILLKPLLLLTSFDALRLMMAASQLILAGWIILSCGRRGDAFLGSAFLLTLPFLYFFSLYLSLSLSICFYVLGVSLLVQLGHNERLMERGGYGAFFAAVGMATAYFDLLTYPLVTLGIPLCVYLYLNHREWRKGLRGLVFCSAEWSVGYLGFWAMKWVIVDLCFGMGTIGDGVATLMERTRTAAGQTPAAGFGEVLGLNAGAYLNWPFFLLAAGICLWLALRVWKSRREADRASLSGALPLFVAALYPFAWFFLTQNHSGEHYMFTYKILSVTVFAGICGVGKLCRGGGEKNR